MEFARFELELELRRLDWREPDERGEDARLLGLEPAPLLRLELARAAPEPLLPEPLLLDRVEPGRREELERLVVDEFLVCWAI